MTNNFTKVNITGEFEGKKLTDALAAKGYFLSADCGGRGVCGKCGVIADGVRVKACRFIVGKDGTEVFLPRTNPAEILSKSDNKRDAVLDIGTTSLELGIVENGNIVEVSKTLNPGRAHGADVLSRIEFSKTNADLLQKELKDEIDRIAQENNVVIKFACGNPTMTHILAGVYAAQLGESPFKAVFSEPRNSTGITILPGSDKNQNGSAFIGSDIIAGAYNLKLGENEILCDLGTNGEMVICRNGQYLAASASCGPCFEGANITCGVSGTEGAVDSFEIKEGKPCFTTVSGAEPCGICGAGLIDLTASLLNAGIITKDGYMEDDYHITKDVYLTPKDVRNLQLAKSAVRSCFEGLLKEAAVSVPEKIYVAGNFGLYANPESMIRIGLFPKSAAEKIVPVGNAALKGTADVFRNGIQDIVCFSHKIKVLNTAENPDFNTNFIRYIDFED